MNDDCVRARGRLAQWADGDLAAAQASWMERHWEECAACRGERERFQAFDRRLLAFGLRIEPPEEGAAERVRYLARIAAGQRERRKPRALIAAAMALAAAAALVISLPQRSPSGARTGGNGFVAVPYVPPLASYERSSVASMQIPVADLIAEGYSVGADPSAVVQADVLLGEDGRVHAVRLAADQILKGTGD